MRDPDRRPGEGVLPEPACRSSVEGVTIGRLKLDRLKLLANGRPS